MTKRRSRGDGGLSWDERRQRWIASVTVGYDGRGKRIYRRASGKTKTGAKEKLKEIQRAYDDGMVTAATGYTVGDAVTYWLAYGLSGRDPHTVEMYRTYAETHIIPALGKRKLRELTVEDVEKLLTDKSATLSTRSLRIIHSILNRAVRKAQVRDKIRRNIVLLCEVPGGRTGRPSKSLTLVQAEAVLKAAEQAPARMHAYHSVAGGGWKWPDMPSSCDDLGWEWPGVSWCLRPLALGLALGIPAPETALLILIDRRSAQVAMRRG
jgi:Phage integrase, N-terminal SAM-like domain